MEGVCIYIYWIIGNNKFYQDSGYAYALLTSRVKFGRVQRNEMLLNYDGNTDEDVEFIIRKVHISNVRTIERFVVSL